MHDLLEIFESFLPARYLVMQLLQHRAMLFSCLFFPSSSFSAILTLAKRMLKTKFLARHVDKKMARVPNI